uniref:EB domain-containing protein n=2 Tax=Ditylenchus dipsaci TaxID=166011 RepID=A0A915CP01_9BILA
MEIAKSVPIGSLCTSTSQCTSGAFCSHSVCRRASCQIHGECAKGELCFYGKADGEFRDACFPLNDHKFKNFAWCPGNGEIMKTLEGKLKLAILNRRALQPMFATLSTVFAVLVSPMLPVVEVLTGKPILCKLRGSPVLECPLGSHCQAQTGFCCTDQDLADKPTTPAPIRRKSEPRVVDLLVQKKSSASVEGLIELPTVGHSCKTGKGCAYGAVCQCLTQNYQGDGNEKGCRCECPKEMGYTLAVDGKTCKRSRRKLKEKCMSDLECLAAYSECTSGGCRCKSGFQRDGNGGCKPIAFKCVNQAEALKFDGRIIGCVLEKRKTFARYHQAHQEISSDSENLSSGSEKVRIPPIPHLVQETQEHPAIFRNQIQKRQALLPVLLPIHLIRKVLKRNLLRQKSLKTKAEKQAFPGY